MCWILLGILLVGWNMAELGGGGVAEIDGSLTLSRDIRRACQLLEKLQVEYCHYPTLISSSKQPGVDQKLFDKPPPTLSKLNLSKISALNTT